MSDRFIVGAPLGRWQTNCFVVGDRDLGRAVVVDPGEHAPTEAARILDQQGVTCEAILLTHAHIDHLWGAPELARRYEAPVFLHPGDRWLWEDPAAAFGSPPELITTALGLPPWDPPTEQLQDLADGQTLTFAGVRFGVRHTPGHTPGHVTFLGRGLAGVPVGFALGGVEEAPDGVLLSGDLLFAGSIGRTDLARGSDADMQDSLATTVLPLDDDVLVLSGHGPDTTIGRERATNPFLRQAAARNR